MRKRNAVTFVASMLAAAAAQAQTAAYWKFDEGSFQPGCPSNPLYNQGHIVD